MSAAVEQAGALTPASSSPQLADLVYHLIFDDYCDWYLELLKAGEATPEVAGPRSSRSSRWPTRSCPFVTEECWSRLPGSARAHGCSTRPPAAPGPVDHEAEAEVAGVQEVVTGPAGLPLEPRPAAPRAAGRWSRRPARPRAPSTRSPPRRPRLAADAHHGPPRRMAARSRSAPAEERIDPAAERSRLAGELAKAQTELARAQAKLANPAFVERAPAPLVEAERDKVARYATERDALADRLAALGA